MGSIRPDGDSWFLPVFALSLPVTLLVGLAFWLALPFKGRLRILAAIVSIFAACLGFTSCYLIAHALSHV